ncbi:MAG: tetratricopeptide repeat protein [Chlamydiales bacterium]
MDPIQSFQGTNQLNQEDNFSLQNFSVSFLDDHKRNPGWNRITIHYAREVTTSRQLPLSEILVNRIIAIVCVLFKGIEFFQRKWNETTVTSTTRLNDKLFALDLEEPRIGEEYKVEALNLIQQAANKGSAIAKALFSKLNKEKGADAQIGLALLENEAQIALANESRMKSAEFFLELALENKETSQEALLALANLKKERGHFLGANELYLQINPEAMKNNPLQTAFILLKQKEFIAAWPYLVIGIRNFNPSQDSYADKICHLLFQMLRKPNTQVKQKAEIIEFMIGLYVAQFHSSQTVNSSEEDRHLSWTNFWQKWLSKEVIPSPNSAADLSEESSVVEDLNRLTTREISEICTSLDKSHSYATLVWLIKLTTNSPGSGLGDALEYVGSAASSNQNSQTFEQQCKFFEILVDFFYDGGFQNNPLSSRTLISRLFFKLSELGFDSISNKLTLIRLMIKSFPTQQLLSYAERLAENSNQETRAIGTSLLASLQAASFHERNLHLQELKALLPNLTFYGGKFS